MISYFTTDGGKTATTQYFTDTCDGAPNALEDPMEFLLSSGGSSGAQCCAFLEKKANAHIRHKFQTGQPDYSLQLRSLLNRVSNFKDPQEKEEAIKVCNTQPVLNCILYIFQQIFYF